MNWYEGLEHILRPEEPLAPYCWLGLGGVAEYLANPNSLEELRSLVDRARSLGMNMRVLGGGSNLLINDLGIPGLVIKLDAPAFCQIEVVESQLIAGGGASLTHAIAQSVGAGLSGMESLVGIPGTIGGALHGNSGDRTAEIGPLVVDAVVLTRTGELKTRTQQELQFAYRDSSLTELAIIQARFGLEPDNREDLVRRFQREWIVKRAHQPTRDRRTACLFKDPPGITAGELIEQSGLKGVTVHGAGLYDRDLNFVLASPGATSKDILQLIEMVREKVARQTGIELERALEVW
jgi:UDP-N-acetylmuramate dehydrogenase